MTRARQGDGTHSVGARADVSTRAAVSGGVVIGHDGSPDADEALRWAAALAERASWPLHVVRAWHLATAPQPPGWAFGYVPPLTEYEAAVLADVRSDVVAGLGAERAAVVTCHAVHAAPGSALVDAGRHADVLVVGARGHGALARFVLGSVSDHVTRHPPCPVTVVPHGRSALGDSG
ncbi:nucleotide-binding universal stress UspA family protein [Blastococcus saxobsidens]|uniref:Nucleotide-binding universal stress UspA family protein n=1 Tax=Blastococcus saxobsidens TaxID=138336 RepID=A0A4Q7Y699_9ACTN|nr:nucleotide-binding universal stress UspA family protein [Blastococcus saxobsidens]